MPIPDRGPRAAPPRAPSAPASARSAGRHDLYRSVWRWHSYAGLAVLPFLFWLAVTGAIYLYKPEIESALYGDWTRATAAGPVLPVSVIADRVAAATGTRVAQLAKPAAAGESWRATLVRPDGGKRTAFVDPGDGRVLGVVAAGGVMATVRDLHSLAITGPIGNALIEIAAGWAIILVATGAYLWWPRGGGRALALRGRPGGRLFWRDLHASTGAVAGFLLLFLAVTGMPWSGVWGGMLQRAIAAQGLGRPEAPRMDGGDHHGHGDPRGLPWSLERGAVPAGGPDRIGPDRALAAARERGISGAWTLTFPAAPGAPYLVSAAVVQAADAHAVYVDASTGAVLQDARFPAFGAGARAVEWGIAVHQGQQYGEPNRLLMLGGCLLTILLCVTAPVMWWKRRPAARAAGPDRRTARGLATIMAAAGLLFPLTGATMLAALAWDRFAGRRTRATGPA